MLSPNMGPCTASLLETTPESRDVGVQRAARWEWPPGLGQAATLFRLT